MNLVDSAVLLLLNHGAQKWATFDQAVVWASNSPLVKGCVVVAVIVALWCGSPIGQLEKRRTDIFAVLIAALAAMFAARVLAMSLPFRPRPIHNPAFSFALPDGMDPAALDGWSAFPSDHAVLFFAVATGIVFVSWRAGLFLLLHATIVVCLPRLYLGLHHPSDILAGALLGVIFGLSSQVTFIWTRLARVRIDLQSTFPFAFYAFGWYFLYELANMFGALRALVKLLVAALRT